MKKKPLVSLTIPIYGVEKYIKQCAESLMSQTYPNIEYIFVNDCTKDNSITILEQVIANYPDRKKNVTIINKQQNEGIAQARKTGMMHCKGDYVMLLDSDDWVEKNMVERMVNTISKANCDILYADYFKIQEGFTSQLVNCIDIENPEECIKSFLQLKAPAQTWNKIYRRHLFDNIEYTKDSMHDDLFINLQVFNKASSIYHLKEHFYHYRINPNSITRNYPVMSAYGVLCHIRNYIEINSLYQYLPSYYSFLNYVKSFVLKKKRPIDLNQIKHLFNIDPQSNKFIFQNQQFNNRKTQCYLFIWTMLLYPLCILNKPFRQNSKNK